MTPNNERGELTGKNIVLIEPNPTGHRLMYVRLIIAEAQARGDSVTLVLHNDHHKDPAVDLHLGKFSGQFTTLLSSDFTLDGVAAITRNYHPDLTIIPDGDRIARELALRRAWSGHGGLRILIMRADAQQSRIPGVRLLKAGTKRLLYRRAAAIDGVRIAFLASAISPQPAVAGRFAVACDPIEMSASDEDADALRDSLKMGHERYWFGVLGAITPRKNLPLISEALLASAPERTGLLVAGVCDETTLVASSDALDRYRERGGELVVINRLLTENELDSAVRAVDCVLLIHSNEGPSGLFGKALAAGTRVIAAGARSLRRDASNVGAHASWCPLHVKKLSKEMMASRLQQEPAPYPMPNPRRFAQTLID